MDFEIEDIVLSAGDLLTAFVCRRRGGRPKQNDTTRKFVADCGTKFIVKVTTGGKVRSIEPEALCKRDCPKCQDRIAKIRELIEGGK